METNKQEVFYDAQWQHFEINEDNVRVIHFTDKKIRIKDAGIGNLFNPT